MVVERITIIIAAIIGEESNGKFTLLLLLLNYLKSQH
jgi:hypothetical protein